MARTVTATAATIAVGRQVLRMAPGLPRCVDDTTASRASRNSLKHSEHWNKWARTSPEIGSDDDASSRRRFRCGQPWRVGFGNAFEKYSTAVSSKSASAAADSVFALMLFDQAHRWPKSYLP